MAKTDKVMFYTHIEIGYSHGFENNTHGIPFSGMIVASDKADALKKAKEYGESMATKIFENHNIHNLITEDCDVILHVTHSLQVLKVDVREDFLISSWGDAHNEKLREIINHTWSHAKYRNSFKEIMSAYWERDKEEMADRYDTDCIWWHLSELSFEDACEKVDWETIIEEWANHVADDEDIRCVIDYIRPRDLYPNLDWYNA